MPEPTRYRYFIQVGISQPEEVTEKEFIAKQSELGFGQSPTNWVWVRGHEKVWGWSVAIREMPAEYSLP